MGRKKKYHSPEGLVRQKNSNHWYIKCRINGRLIYKTTRTPDILQAELLLSKVKVVLLSLDSQVKQIIANSIPFLQLIQRYLREISPNKLPSESDKFRSKPLIEYFGDRRIDTATTQDVYRYQDWRKNQISPKSNKIISGPTVNREISLLRRALRKAVRWGYLEHSPVEGIKGFSGNRRERYIANQEFEAIKEAARSHPYSKHLADIMDALYNTAQRSGRILNLKWNQMDLKERTISFEQVSRTKLVPFMLWINQPLYQLLTRLKSTRSFAKVVGRFVSRKRDGTLYNSVDGA